MTDHDRLNFRPPWSRSDRFVPRVVVRPAQEFLQTSAAAGGLLAIAVVTALVWANSPWHAGYERLWATPVGVQVDGWHVTEDLRFWVNEGLMTFFFLLAGIEIKRELITGELMDRRKAVLPVLGAIGGMAVPALIYLALTRGTGAADGWGVAMPTDLAFALVVLALAARSAPPGLRPFLLTLAVVDDLLTIVVVALFYSQDITWAPLGLAGFAGLAIVGLQRLHVRHLVPYVATGIIMWLATYESGVHPALVGAAVGLLTPALGFHRPAHVSEAAHRIADETEDEPEPPDAPRWFELSRLSREAVSPLARVEHELIPWVNLAALPLFALANAGVRFTGDALEAGVQRRLVVSLVVARLVGKLVGVAGVCLLAARAGIGRLPGGASARALAGVAAAASSPFTVSLFVAAAAFPANPDLYRAAQVGVLLSIAVSGAAAMAILHVGSRLPDRGA